MQLIINILIDFALFLIVSYSFSICYRTMGFFNLAHAASLTLAAYLVYSFSSLMSFPLWISIILSVILVLAVMVLIDRCLYLPGRKKGYEGWKLMVASLGVYIVFQNVISLIWNDSSLSFRTWTIKPGHPFLGGSITDVEIITLVASAVLLLCVWLFHEKTLLGLRIRAVSINPELSTILGIRKERATAISVAIGSAMMACAGVLIAAAVDMTPTMGFNWLLYGMVAMIVAGTGRTQYLILGALFLSVAKHLSANYIGGDWEDATAYVILIIFLYIRPFGFSGQKLIKTEV